jgi:hypothetical protein
VVNIVTAIATVKLATVGQQKLLRHTLDGVRTVFRIPVADLPDRLNKLQSFAAKSEGGERRIDVVELKQD